MVGWNLRFESNARRDANCFQLGNRIFFASVRSGYAFPSLCLKRIQLCMHVYMMYTCSVCVLSILHKTLLLGVIGEHALRLTALVPPIS